MLIRWVRLVEAHARFTLLLLIALTLAAGVTAVFFGAINSDLSKLVKPSDDLQWYQDNENYKQAFPLLQQTAVVVVSGADAEKVETVAKSIEAALLREPIFSDVFAPAIVSSPVFITAPAAATFAAAVTSAFVSIPLNLLLSETVIIAPLPTSVTSDNAVTDDVV